MRILHVDDDPLQLKLARIWLEDKGHTVVNFMRGEDAIKAVERDSFDLAILDWVMPDTTGEEVLVWIRQRGFQLPVMFLTSNESEDEIAHILGAGADDYVVKPLRPREFLARVEALGRRKHHAALHAVLEVGPYRIESRTRTIWLDGKAVKMTSKMASIALMLFARRGEIVSRSQLYQRVWGRREKHDTRTIDTHVSRLRSLLELDGRHGWRLASVYQHGYRLEEASNG